MGPLSTDPNEEVARMFRDFEWTGRELAEDRAFDLHRTAQEMAAESEYDDGQDEPDPEETVSRYEDRRGA